VGAEALSGTPTGVTRRAVISNVSMVTSKNVSEDPFLSVSRLDACSPPPFKGVI
jgi:hypothetical protein